jgi:thiosulfate dehydrogenase [quinone] large subunit
MHHREIAYAILRITYGVIFFFFGVGKFKMGLAQFVSETSGEFSGKLPMFMVVPSVYVIPFAEVLLGVLILFGLLTRLALTLSGLSLLGLSFGLVMLGQGQLVANNLTYMFVNFLLLWLVDANRYSLDSLFWRPAPADSEQD